MRTNYILHIAVCMIALPEHILKWKSKNTTNYSKILKRHLAACEKAHLQQITTHFQTATPYFRAQLIPKRKFSS